VSLSHAIVTKTTMGAVRNVLFIMCDQLRRDHLSCYGGRVPTPNIDALAARGVRFDHAYVQSGVCGPSRMSFYTGRYVSSHGATWNRVPLSLAQPTLGDYLAPRTDRRARRQVARDARRGGHRALRHRRVTAKAGASSPTASSRSIATTAIRRLDRIGVIPTTCARMATRATIRGRTTSSLRRMAVAWYPAGRCATCTFPRVSPSAIRKPRT
jgi:hypothetical protein